MARIGFPTLSERSESEVKFKFDTENGKLFPGSLQRLSQVSYYFLKHSTTQLLDISKESINRVTSLFTCSSLILHTNFHHQSTSPPYPPFTNTVLLSCCYHSSICAHRSIYYPNDHRAPQPDSHPHPRDSHTHIHTSYTLVVHSPLQHTE